VSRNGEIVGFASQGRHSHKTFTRWRHGRAIFEYIYFARPGFDSRRPRASRVRKTCGAGTRHEAPARQKCRAGLPIPELPAATAFARPPESYELGLRTTCRPHLIEPTQQIRRAGVRLKSKAQTVRWSTQADRAGRRFES